MENVGISSFLLRSHCKLPAIVGKLEPRYAPTKTVQKGQPCVPSSLGVEEYPTQASQCIFPQRWYPAHDLPVLQLH